MKRLLLTPILAFALIVGVQAQTNLAGHVFHNQNVMAGEMNAAMKEAQKNLPEARAKAIAEAEKKKGRKLTDKEIAKLDAEIAESQKKMEAIKNGMSIAITATFLDAKQVEMKMDVKMNDDALKAAGIGWLKRKAMLAAMAIAPKSQKSNYVVKGNMVIVLDEKEGNDTLRISPDGKSLSGKKD